MSRRENYQSKQFMKEGKKRQKENSGHSLEYKGDTYPEENDIYTKGCPISLRDLERLDRKGIPPEKVLDEEDVYLLRTKNPEEAIIERENKLKEQDRLKEEGLDRLKQTIERVKQIEAEEMLEAKKEKKRREQEKRRRKKKI